MKNSIEKQTKNCKNQQKNVKNDIKNAKISKKLTIEQIELLAWIKTIISVHDVIPNIIRLIDKIVNAKSSSAISGSLIFGDYKNGTYGQVQEILDLSDRKISLINLYSIIDNITSSLKDDYKKFVELKFYKHKKVAYIAEELEIDERSVYRWSNVVLIKMLQYALDNNLTVKFFKSQLKRESWLLENYSKHYASLIKLYKVSM